MKVLQINTFGNLSTGRIAVDIYRTLSANGDEGKVAFARNRIAEDVPYIKIGTDFDVKLHGLMTRITDKTGFYSSGVTKKLLAEIEEYNPDVIHLHNIHGYYLNIELLFNYLKSSGKPVVWTLHDCWAFTGHCCYYSMAGCDRWKTHCYDCPQKHAYPSSKLIDNSQWNYKNKKRLFCGVPNMTIVAVSNWLAGEVKQSFLKDYSLKVIYNGIDLNVFKPTKSDFREKYNIKNKFIILGVASTWDVRKGLKYFVQLARELDDSFKVVVVGVNEQEKASLPDSIIGIPRTDSIGELAGIYTTADVFFNASVEETFGLPTVEAMACQTPVIVYNATALPEVVDESVGYIVENGDIKAVKNIVKSLKQEKHLFSYSKVDKFDKTANFYEYISLYQKILHT